MSTSNAHQRSLADDGLDTPPPMLERRSYISWANYDDEYQGETFQNDPRDSLTNTIMLLARAITQHYSTPTNNQLRSSSNTRNQAVVQADRVHIQSENVGNDGRISRHSYNVQEESTERSNVQKETGNVQRNLLTFSSGNVTNVQCYNCSEKGHYAQLEELSVNICMMAIIQPANIDSDEGHNYDSEFISEEVNSMYLHLKKFQKS
nr:hypothetical protein [Tanacetum cinerariifolium]